MPGDAVAACDIMRASIIELCTADHHNDAGILRQWLANKVPTEFRSWIRPGNSVLVAIRDERVVAVGAVTDAGRIILNYVSPPARFRGVSRAMLRALEARASARGAAQCTLNSTETARRFYLDAGYIEQGPPERPFGTRSGYPMARPLP